jgi:tetratricopeptide (TPR) repeat protein
MGWVKRSYDWDWAGADAAYKRAVELERGNADVVRGAASLASTLGRFGEEIRRDRRAIELDPLRVPTYINLGQSPAWLRQQNDSAFQIAEIYAFRNEADKAFEWLERAYKQRDGGLAQIKCDPLLRNIQKDPRYRLFLQKMKLPID